MGFPVFKAFGAGVAYIVVHFFTIIRVLWLPTLLLMALQYILMPSMLGAQTQLAGIEDGGDPSAVFSAMGPMFKSMALLYLAMAIFYPMMIAGVLRHVVRGESPRLPFYLRFGGDELRILAAFILLIIMTIILYVVGVLVVMALGVVLSAVSPALGGIVIGILVLVLVCMLIWFMVRMSLVFAAAIGERSIGIGESWRLTAGSFWGLFLYWIFWTVMLFLVVIAYFALSSTGYVSLMMEMVTSGGDAAAMEELQRRMLEMQLEMWDLSKPRAWVFAGSTYLYTIVYNAVWTSAGGVAYRYLAGSERA